MLGCILLISYTCNKKCKNQLMIINNALLFTYFNKMTYYRNREQHQYNDYTSNKSKYFKTFCYFRWNITTTAGSGIIL